MQDKMIQAYLGQSIMYYSASKDALIPIAGMAPSHAANAADRMIRDAVTWRTQAGLQRARGAAGWMAIQPVVQALANRGHRTGGKDRG